MESFSALMALCEGNSPVTGEFPAQRPVTWSFDVFFDLRLNRRLSRRRWFETPWRSLWRHCNDVIGPSHHQGLLCAFLAYHIPFFVGLFIYGIWNVRRKSDTLASAVVTPTANYPWLMVFFPHDGVKLTGYQRLTFGVTKVVLLSLLLL